VTAAYFGAKHWKPAVLQDLVFLQRGYDITKAQQKEGDVPVFSSSGLNSWHNEAAAKGPGVIIGRKGTLGSVHYSENDYWPHDTTLWSKSLNGNNPRFVYYALKCLGLERFNVGGANPTLNRNHIHGLPIFLPDRHTQDDIVEILSSYDDLIENNRRRITLLKEAARMLYREWFVHFRFPGHDGHHRVKTPIGSIPQGWEVTKLGAITTKIGSGATPRGGEQSYKAEGIALIRSLNIYDYRFEFDDLAFIDEQQAAELDNVTVEENDILLNITGASVARCALVPSYLLPARVNQHVAIVRADPAKASPFYILDSINSESRKAQLFALARAGGATREALTKSTLGNFEIILPPRLLLSSYREVAQGIHKQREVLMRQIQSLRRARDLLLPRLMNGEIAV
jgi:type I restriction enzyme S subunit